MMQNCRTARENDEQQSEASGRTHCQCPAAGVYCMSGNPSKADKVGNPNPIPSIRLLKIERFRGIEKLEWRPSPGLNVIVGPGDTCKSTVLEAIAALLSPAPNTFLSEFDYFKRDIESGFMIEAVVAVGNAAIVKTEKFPTPPLQGWLGNQLVDLPDENGAEAVLVCRLSATSDQEAVFEIVGAGEENTTSFPRALRQRLGLLRFGITDRFDRDLRLVQGGALDRFMEGKNIRQSVLQVILKTPIHDQLGEDSQTALSSIETQFKKKSLPHPVRLGLVGTPGVSLAASVGLMVGENDESALPLPSWGTGTRRLASLELAAILTNSMSMAVVDEPECGLEPYRQRAFMGDLHQDGTRQAFITTHSPAVLSAASAANSGIWRINPVIYPPVEQQKQGGHPDAATTRLNVAKESFRLTKLDGTEIQALIQLKPEAVLAKLPIICEGETEEGFTTKLFESKFGKEYLTRGIFLVDAGGHDRALPICQSLINAGFQLAAVVDDEGRKSGSWKTVGEKATLLQWINGSSLEKAVITTFPENTLPDIISWPEEFDGRPAVHCLAEVRQALGVGEKGKSPEDLLNEFGREKFVEALCNAACPPRTGNRKPTGWFKSFEGGYLLATKLLSLDPKPKLFDQIDVFLSKVEKAVPS